MGITLPFLYKMNAASSHRKHGPYLGQCAFSQEDLGYLFSAKLGLSVFPHRYRMDHIFSSCAIFQVGKSIVRVLAILMIYLFPIGDGSEESQCDEAVNKEPSSGSMSPESNGYITLTALPIPVLDGTHDVSCTSAAIIIDCANKTLGRGLIKSLVSWYVSPIFGTINIHVASFLGDVRRVMRFVVAWPSIIIQPPGDISRISGAKI